jgi:uncharacterized membrane protein
MVDEIHNVIEPRNPSPARSGRAPGDAAHVQATNPDHVAETVGEIVELENRSRVEMTGSDRLADLITAFAGSMLFVGLHVIWFGGWILLNLPFLGIEFDPYPFGLLTMIVSLEAIFLSTFVLISQNRQALHADRRAKVDLEVNVISEREITKLIELVSDIHSHMNGRKEHDPGAQKMMEQTPVSRLADAVDEAEKEAGDEGSRTPNSAADTDV